MIPCPICNEILVHTSNSFTGRKADSTSNYECKNSEPHSKSHFKINIVINTDKIYSFYYSIPPNNYLHFASWSPEKINGYHTRSKYYNDADIKMNFPNIAINELQSFIDQAFLAIKLKAFL